MKFQSAAHQKDALVTRHFDIELELAAAGPSAIQSFAPEPGEHVRTGWTAPDGKRFTSEIFCGTTEVDDPIANTAPTSIGELFVPIYKLIMSLPIAGPATITIGPPEGFRESDLPRRLT